MQKITETARRIWARVKELRRRLFLFLLLVPVLTALLLFAAVTPFNAGSNGITWQNPVGCRAEPRDPGHDLALTAPLCQTVPSCTYTAAEFRSDCSYRDWWLSFALMQPTAENVRAVFLERFPFADSTTKSPSLPSQASSVYRQLLAQAYASISTENASKWRSYLLWQATSSAESDTMFQQFDAAEAILRAVPLNPTSSFTAWQTRAANYAQSQSDAGVELPVGFSSPRSLAKFESDTVAHLQLLINEVGA
jgi:hypothetical protein